MIRLAALVLGLAIFGIGAAGAQAPTATAIFAGGCFWCVEADFDKVPGVISTTSGYTGGHVANATYQQVSAGGTGHAEAVEVVYRQFCDVGDQYRTAIFVRNDAERRLAEASKKQVAAELKATVYTEIAAAGPFYKAEEYHQDYYVKNPVRYKFYRWNCGRDQRIEEVWGRHDKSS